MSKKEKLIAKLLQCPNNFTWNELTSLLKSFDYKEAKTGKSGGSRRRFIHDNAATISLHKPHPQNTLKQYAIDQIIEVLEQEDMI
ncbi:MAG: type II toxin-antitoxin system HicA family toxin [Proteobacteria bacterium]|nr:type II toxin-antitoxin system HicA family toxin [Pseudomonadota bacterium]